MAKFNEILRYLRTSRDITQAELAKVIGVSPSTIGMYESGVREPNFEIEEKIADYFNVSLDMLRGKKGRIDEIKALLNEVTIMDEEDLEALKAVSSNYGSMSDCPLEESRDFGTLDELIKPNNALLETYNKLSANSQNELMKYAEYLLAREKNT